MRTVRLGLFDNSNRSLINECIYGTLVNHGISRCELDTYFGLSQGCLLLVDIKRELENGNFNKDTVVLIDELGDGLSERYQETIAEILVNIQINTNAYIVANSYSDIMLKAIRKYSDDYKISDRLNIYEMEKVTEHSYTAKNITCDI